MGWGPVLYKWKPSLRYVRCRTVGIVHVSCDLASKALFMDSKDHKKCRLFLYDVIIEDMAVSVDTFFKCFPLHTGPSLCKFERLVGFGVIAYLPWRICNNGVPMLQTWFLATLTDGYLLIHLDQCPQTVWCLQRGAQMKQMKGRGDVCNRERRV